MIEKNIFAQKNKTSQEHEEHFQKNTFIDINTSLVALGALDNHLQRLQNPK